MSPLNRLLANIRSSKKDSDNQNLYKDLVHQEAKIGGKLFGSIPEGNEREFFCLDDHTWVWSESWQDQDGQHTLTTRYEIRGDKVIKVQNGTYYQLSLNEKKHLKAAIELYYKEVMQTVYPQYVGKAA